MMEIFAGFTGAYGLYTLSGQVDDRGKQKGKGRTIREPVTPELWHNHITGKEGLGIIPINEKSQVKWGAIDIDEYQIDLIGVIRKVRDFSLPLVPFQSKSGGLHLYLFVSEFVPAKLVQNKLRELASFLGHGDAEIFPKQTEIIAERGDMGQWINMPYFGESRRAIDTEKLKNVTLDEFIATHVTKQVSPQQLREISPKVPDTLAGGPPCLQVLIKHGFPPGTRNNGLFNMAIYAKMFSPDEMPKLVEEYNKKYMDPPLASTEVLGIIKSMGKKDYMYTCNQEPIKRFCNKSKCRTCKFGIGSSTGMPEFGTLTKLCTDPPVWFLEVANGGRVELDTEDLQTPLRFQRRCMDFLNIMPPLLDRAAWSEIVQKLLEDVCVIEVPKDTTPKGQFLELLEIFLLGKFSGTRFEELLIGKPIIHDGFHYFRIKDLMNFFQRMKFDMKLNRVCIILRDMGAEHDFKNIENRGVNLWRLPEIKRSPVKLPVKGIIDDDAF